MNRMDSSHSRPPGSRLTRPSQAQAQNLLLPAAATGESNSVTCNCGQEAVLLTVRKDGPNQGRQFYKCSTGACSFFLWADSSPPGAGGALDSASRLPGSSSGHPAGPGHHADGFSSNPSGGSGSGTFCLCSHPAVTRTVQKDGPNKGRQFHTCAKPREQQCGFFQWADENTAPGLLQPFLGQEAEEKPRGQKPGAKEPGPLPQTQGPQQRNHGNAVFATSLDTPAPSVTRIDEGSTG